MAGEISELVVLAAGPAADDLLETTDVDDTTDSAGGTSKQVTFDVLMAGVFAGGILTIEEVSDLTLALTTPRLIRIEGGAGADPATLTIPPNSSVAFPIGTFFFIQSFFLDFSPQLIPGAAVTLQGHTLQAVQNGTFTFGADGGMVLLVKTATDVWDLMFFNYTTPAWS